MNTLKHMEAIFVAALGLACSATVVLDTVPQAQAAAAIASASAPASIPVVVIRAKRMTPAEKRQSLRDEEQLAGANGAAQGHI